MNIPYSIHHLSGKSIRWIAVLAILFMLIGSIHWVANQAASLSFGTLSAGANAQIQNAHSLPRPQPIPVPTPPDIQKNMLPQSTPVPPRLTDVTPSPKPVETPPLLPQGKR